MRNTDISLHEACGQGYLAVVREKLRRGGGVDERNDEGDTPLHVAAEEGKVDIINLLVEHNARFHEENDGQTPLDRAFDRKHVRASRSII